jgi:hypothetical protein
MSISQELFMFFLNLSEQSVFTKIVMWHIGRKHEDTKLEKSIENVQSQNIFGATVTDNNFMKTLRAD